MLVGVGQRQERQEGLVVVQPEPVEQPPDPADVPHDVVVAEHDALGPAPGARRVDQASEVVAWAACRPGRRRRLAAERQGVRPAQHRERAASSIGSMNRTNRTLGAWATAGRSRFASGWRNRSPPWPAVPEQVGVVVRRVGGVGRHGDGARAEDREVGDAPLGPVLRHDQHAVARPTPSWPTRGPAGPPPRHAPPAPRAVAALSFGPQERPVAALASERWNIATRLAPRSGIAIDRPCSPKRGRKNPTPARAAAVRARREHEEPASATGDRGPVSWKPGQARLISAAPKRGQDGDGEVLRNTRRRARARRAWRRPSRARRGTWATCTGARMTRGSRRISRRRMRPPASSRRSTRASCRSWTATRWRR